MDEAIERVDDRNSRHSRMESGDSTRDELSSGAESFQPEEKPEVEVKSAPPKAAPPLPPSQQRSQLAPAVPWPADAAIGLPPRRGSAPTSSPTSSRNLLLQELTQGRREHRRFSLMNAGSAMSRDSLTRGCSGSAGNPVRSSLSNPGGAISGSAGSELRASLSSSLGHAASRSSALTVGSHSSIAFEKDSMEVQPEEVGLSREDRLRLAVTTDQNVESLLMQIRKVELLTVREAETERLWEERHITSAKLILTPGSSLKAYWDILLIALVVISAVVMPLDFAFDLGRTGGSLVLFIILDVCFVLDFLLQFRIAFATPDSQLLIRQPRRIFRRWLAGWFFFDFVAALPLELLSLVPTTSRVEASAFKLVRIVRLAKLPRLLEQNPPYRRLRAHVPSAYLQLLVGFAALLFISHLFGCVYVVISEVEVNGALDAWARGQPDPERSVANLTHANMITSSWLPPADFLKVSVSSDGVPRVDFGSGEVYIFAVLWVLTAVSGTSTPRPETLAETVFTVILVPLGFFVTAYVIGTFTTAISQLSAAQRSEFEKRDYIDQFLIRKRIPKALRRQVAQFYEFAGFDESEEMLAELPVSLRLQLDLVLNRDLFLKVPFFKNCDTSFLVVMVPRIHGEYAWYAARRSTPRATPLMTARDCIGMDWHGLAWIGMDWHRLA